MLRSSENTEKDQFALEIQSPATRMTFNYSACSKKYIMFGLTLAKAKLTDD